MQDLYDIINMVTTIDRISELKKKTNATISELKKKTDASIENLTSNLEEIKAKNKCLIKWKPLTSEVKIPSKRLEDAGLDIYTIEDNIVIEPLTTHFFKTGLCSEFTKDFWVEIKERGSTGAVNLSVRSGVIDSGFRGEWKIMLTNLNRVPIEITSRVDKVEYIYYKWPFNKKLKKILYPQKKAIAQAVIIPLPEIESKIAEEKLSDSSRGESGWGASGK